MKTNVLIIGGIRCGTGWVLDCLSEHPDVFAASHETHFFDRKFTNGIDWWQREFFGAVTNQKVVLEKTANYLYDKKSLKRIKDHLPKIKIICILRNPITRMYSDYMRFAYHKKYNVIEACNIFPEIVNNSKYSVFLKNYLNNFPKENFLILIYEEIRKNKQREFKKIFNFLDINSKFSPKNLNLTTKPGVPELMSIRIKFFYFLQKIIPLPFHIKKYLNNLRKEIEIKKLFTKSEIKFFKRKFEKEIITLELCLNKELTDWRRSIF